MSQFAIPVRDYMKSPVHSITPETGLESARNQLHDLGISCLAVADSGGKVAGVISRTDLLRVGRMQAGARPDAALLTLPDKAVSEVMISNVVQVTPEDHVSLAAGLMAKNVVHRVFVVDGGRPVGVLSTRDIMRALIEKRVTRPIEVFMSSPVYSIRANEPISLATQRLEKARVSGLVVMDDGWPVGLFTQRDALIARHLPRETPVEASMNPSLLSLDEKTPLHRAVTQAAALNARRILATREGKTSGILTGIDLAQAAA